MPINPFISVTVLVFIPLLALATCGSVVVCMKAVAGRVWDSAAFAGFCSAFLLSLTFATAVQCKVAYEEQAPHIAPISETSAASLAKRPMIIAFAICNEQGFSCRSGE
jgi:hypothetical protein